MNTLTADAVICGAGICGISAAYHLAVNQGIRNIVIVDSREPMSFTSDKSSECYRNWWPGPGDTMVRFMNHSIDLLEKLAGETSNRIGLNRRGYIFLTADPNTRAVFEERAREITGAGAGPLRVHRPGSSDPAYLPSPPNGFEGLPSGADLVLDQALIRENYPFITDKAIALLHPRRCGWLDAQQLGAYLLEEARKSGARLMRGKISLVNISGSAVKSIRVETSNGSEEIHTPVFINAAGPFIGEVAELFGINLPVYNELHAKISIRDPLSIVPTDVPLMVWDDPVRLVWSAEERADLAEFEEGRRLLEMYPAGVHFRPEGGEGNASLLGIWTYDTHRQEPLDHPVFDPDYAEIVIRGLANMIPGLTVYLEKLEKPVIDGGYYCKTRENRPLIGPLGMTGSYIFGAVSGFGIMAGMAGGDLLARHVAGKTLPNYAPDFLIDRYEDPAYQSILDQIDSSSGQL